MKVVALAGGVGGAKLAQGLAHVLPGDSLTVVVNTADDFEYLGLNISPDIDTVCYTLAGLENTDTGWGLAGETWRAMSGLEKLGGPTWFRLGDQDLATHLERTRRLKQGRSLSEIVWDFCHAWGIEQNVLPMTNDGVRTIVRTNEGQLDFQDYFVRRHCEPAVMGFEFQNAEGARPAPGVIEALAGADAIVVCPSNPWVSIGPILAIPGIHAAIDRRKTVAVSPIIAGRAVKGPAAKMFLELGIEPSALAVARHYRDLVGSFVIDKQDAQALSAVERLNLQVLVTQTLMATPDDRSRLARAVIDYIGHRRP